LNESEFRLKVAKVARSWIGTPFYAHQAVKGVGTDCIHLARAVFEESGLLKPGESKFPEYALDGGEHYDCSKIVSWLSQSPKFRQKSEVPEAGDLITISAGRVVHHVGVMTGPSQFVQALRRYGVVEVDLRDETWMKRLRSVWSPVFKFT
jgi:cell wall-associated NlpC family hydrolase